MTFSKQYLEQNKIKKIEQASNGGINNTSTVKLSPSSKCPVAVRVNIVNVSGAKAAAKRALAGKTRFLLFTTLQLRLYLKLAVPKVYSRVGLATSSLVTLGGSLQPVGIMLIVLRPITSKVLYLEQIATSSCDAYKIEGVHTAEEEKRGEERKA